MIQEVGNHINPIELEDHLRCISYSAIAGCDEVGRGCLAGPVVAAAVILPYPIPLRGITDSKLLSPKKREELSEEILDKALSWGISCVSPEEIDKINIFQASLLAMRNAVSQLLIKPNIVLVDGKYPIPHLEHPQKTVIKGDLYCASIGAASIIAKVHRDRIMKDYENLYPQFKFSLHKGYATAKHRNELKQFGPCEIHRKSFRLSYE